MTPTPSLSQQLFGFALDWETSAIPSATIHTAALRVVDTIAAALAGASMGMGNAARDIVVSEAGSGRSSVWASGGETRPAAIAAFANGMLAHGMDYDDTQTRATLHPGIVIVPTVLAVGEDVGASGRDVLAAVAIGYEIATRLGEAAPGAFQRQGFHPSSVLGIFGATAAACRLMNVSEDEAVNAAGLAGSMASGLMEYLSDGSEAKQVHPGWVSQGAIRAIQLARHGATGPTTVLEGPKGVFRAFVDREVDVSAVAEGLGATWDGLAVATKPYAACHCVHAPVDSWIQIRDTYGITPADIPHIRSLTGLVPSWYLQLVCDPIEEKRRPRSVYEARFSLPYALGRVVVDGQLTLDSFRLDALNNAEVLEIASKVDYEVVEYPEFPEAFPGGLRVEFDDGRVFEYEMRHNAGSTGNPLTDEQIQAKLLEASHRLTGDQEVGDQLLQAIMQLEGDDSTLEGVTKALAST